MKKTLIGVMVAMMLLVGAETIYGVANTRVTGAPPQTNDITVTVRIPQRVGIFVGNNIDFELATPNAPEVYPPAAFPAYYTPTATNGGNINPQNLQIFSNVAYTLAISPSADFDPSLPATDLEYQANGWAGPGWTPFPAPLAWNNLEVSATRTTGWVDRNLDYRVELTGDEPAGTYTITVTYRMTSP